MDKENVIQTQWVILFSHKEKWSLQENEYVENIILSEMAQIQTKIMFSHVCILAYNFYTYVNRQKVSAAMGYETRKGTIKCGERWGGRGNWYVRDKSRKETGEVVKGTRGKGRREVYETKQKKLSKNDIMKPKCVYAN